MEHGRRASWTGRPRPQHVPARGGFRTSRVNTLIVSPFSTSTRRLHSTPKISPHRPVENAELNRQTRVFRNSVTHTKQRAATCSNRQKNQIWKSDNLGTILTKASAFRDAFLAFLTGSALQTEFAVTRSKQKTGTFLTGSRIARQVITSETVNAKACPPWRACAGKAAQAVGRPRQFVYNLSEDSTFLPGLPRAVSAKGSVCINTFLLGSAQYVEIVVTHSKQSTATFLPGSRIASKPPRKSSNIDTKLSEGCAWLRL